MLLLVLLLGVVVVDVAEYKCTLVLVLSYLTILIFVLSTKKYFFFDYMNFGSSLDFFFIFL
jgi:hypothetical protein